MEWFPASARCTRTRRLWPRVLAGLACLVASSLLAPNPVSAAEFTDLLDAADDKDDFDESTYDPFDLNIEPSFHFDHTRAEILRERPCVPSGHSSLDDDAVSNNPHLEVGDCADPRIVDRKELRYRHTETSVSFDLRLGLYKDLELHASVPYVFQSTYGMKYANNSQFASDQVDASNSSVDPNDQQIRDNAENAYPNGSEDFSNIDRFQKYRYFDVGEEYDSISRSGIGDPSIGIGWAPFNDYRDDTKATLLLGFDWTFPVGNIRKRDNNAVGEGQHKLQFRVASSKKFDWIEPYFGIDYQLPLLTANSPIQELKEVDESNEGQVVTEPPQEGTITLGSEFIVHEEPEKHRRYAFDAQFSFGYTSEGRDYTPLYEHMVNSQCNGMTVGDVKPDFDGNGNLQNASDFACSWVAQRPANFAASTSGNLGSDAYNIDDAADDRELATNGIMTVDDYGTFSGKLGFYGQPSEYFQFKLTAGLTHQLEHFLTNARTGQDAGGDPNDKVDLSGDQAELERNPAYNSTYDSPGTRFKIDNYTGWQFMATGAFQF